MAKYEWSEVFMSVEGEAQYTGHPTAYIRFAKCNFKCKGFNNPDDLDDGKGYAPLEFDPSNYKSLSELQPVEMGCDSQYAVNSTFKHMWHVGDEEDLASALVDVLPHKEWINNTTGLCTIASLTGGEPTLRAKTIPALLASKQLDGIQHLLIETNCAVPLQQKFIDALSKWTLEVPTRKVTWSNSPKLTASGECWKKAIRPEIAVMQNKVIRSEQYFKFVCGNSGEEFDEVQRAMDEYHAGGIPRSAPVYIMPMSCTEAQQDNISANVADMCIDRGFIYCHRVHNSVYANAIGK